MFFISNKILKIFLCKGEVLWIPKENIENNHINIQSMLSYAFPYVFTIVLKIVVYAKL